MTEIARREQSWVERVNELADRAEVGDTFTAEEMSFVLLHVHTPAPKANPMGPQTEWVIVGENRPSSRDVMVVASLELAGRARVDRHLTNLQAARARREPPVYRADVAVHANAIVEVFAPTYGQALNDLMRHWQPRTAGHPGQLTGTREIEA